MECAGAVQHRVELLDVEHRRSAPICREYLRRSLAELPKGACILLAIVVKLVDQGFLGVDGLVDCDAPGF
jgi:hypothetical protein